VFALTPTELRRRAGRACTAHAGTIRLRLAFRRPLSPENLFGHLAATAVPGVEETRDGAYRRTLRLAHGTGIAELRPETAHVAARLTLEDLRDLGTAIARCRWLLDLDADPEAIDAELGSDPALKEAVARLPGRRVPRTVDGAELALRVVLGQQISTAAARTHAARIVARCGEPVTDPDGRLSRLFPAPAVLAGAELAMPRARLATVRSLAGALAGGQLDLTPGSDRAEALSTLGRIPGIGPWSIQVIAMRCLGEPDAFPVGDLGVRRGASALGLPSDPRELAARSRRWSPWRAYAVQHLWGATPHAINRWPADTQADAAAAAPVAALASRPSEIAA
jgi:AraC family transcriptional regulator, regulatory protein of adaptative response / DNA-3-methyladenine glycosylase II